MRNDTEAQVRLQNGLDLLPRLIPGCQHVSATTRVAYGLKVQAASDDTSRQADELQHQLGEGPALQALRTGHGVIAHDLRVEGRWQQWNAQVTSELGLGSVLSVLLVSDRLRIATLNFYSTSPTALIGVDLELLHRLAEPLSDAIVEARI